MPLHVSNTVVLIIMRSKLYYTASGIITPVGGRPVQRLREDSLCASTCFEHFVLIIRRSELHYTASGIIILKQVSGLKLLKYISVNMNTS